MARLSKFASVNLNESYGKPQQTGSAAAAAAANPSASPKPRLTTHGGMLVLSRPSRTQSAGLKSAKLGMTSPSNQPAPFREPPVTDIPVSPASSPLVPGWLKNPQQQQIEQPASTAGSAVKPETPPRGRSGASNVAAEVGSVRNLTGDLTVDVGSQSAVGRPNVYIPPSRRALQANESSTPREAPPPPPEKAVVLRGEEFPTLQASLVRPPTPPQHQQRQRDAHQKQREGVAEQQLKLQQLSQQAHAQKQNTGDVLKLQPAQPMRSQLKQDSAVSEQLVRPTDGPYGEPKNADVFLSTPSPLVRLDHVSNWADDEREVGQTLRLQGTNRLIIAGGETDADPRYFGHNYEFEHSRAGLRADLSEVEHHVAPGDVNYLRDTKRGLEEANATAGLSINERASAGPSINEREGNGIYIPPFAREGSFSRDQAPAREGKFLRGQGPVREGRDRGYERQEGYFGRGGGRPRDSGYRKEYSIGKEQLGSEAFKPLTYSPDGNVSWQNGDGGYPKRGSADKASVSGGCARFSPPECFNQEMRFSRNYGHHSQTEDPFSSRGGARSGYDHRTSRCFYTEPWNASRDTDNSGSRRMASPANDGQFLVSERKWFEVEKCLQEERLKKGENEGRNTRITQEAVSCFDVDLGRTHRLLEEEMYSKRENKGCSTRIALEKDVGHERFTMEESRYLHNVGFREIAARTEQDTRVDWMFEHERRSFEGERREAAIRKFTEQEESIAQREVEERNWRGKSEVKRKNEVVHMVDANYLSMMQQKEEDAASAEPEWEHMVDSFSGPAQSGNDFSLRPSSAASSSSTQLSQFMAEELCQQSHPIGTNNSIGTGLLENTVGKESKSNWSKSPASWRKEANVSSNGATSKLFSSPYVESSDIHRSTDSGSLKVRLLL